ncbi:MAG TPA: DUF5317 domain-containing protein [Chloroflexota bacterium]|nr:DUF5317 domain-containing protein [Chloroflexota bacterium]
MVLFWAVAGGVLVGLAAGGQIAHLARLQVRYAWLVLPAFIFQLLLIFTPPTPPEQGVDPLRIVLPLSFVPLLAFVLGNRTLPGMKLVLIGFAANAAVILANGGLMPTNEAALERAGQHGAIALAREHPGMRLPQTKDILLPIEQTPLWWLSDTLVSPPIPKRKYMSVGDLFVGAGMAFLAFQATRGVAGSRERALGQDRRRTNPTERSENELRNPYDDATGSVSPNSNLHGSGSGGRSPALT